MITKEKSPIRVLFFRDHEIKGAGQAEQEGITPPGTKP
jgi:hypothetical protein